MVGIVIVSHSEAIVRGVLEVCRQMVDVSIPMAGVGGMPNGDLGTDPTMIEKAILEVNQQQGVVVLVGIGSAVLAAEVAIEMLHEQVRCTIADAPLVEGSVAAALKAYIGGTFEEVIEAAESAKHLTKVHAVK